MEFMINRTNAWISSIALFNRSKGSFLLFVFNYLHLRTIAANYLLENKKTDDGHFYHLLKFFDDLILLGYEPYVCKQSEPNSLLSHIELFIFFDYSAITQYQIKAIKNVNNAAKLILCLAENPNYLFPLSKRLSSSFDKIYCPYEIDHAHEKTETAFVYKSIPSFTKQDCGEQVVLETFDSSIINSNLHSFSNRSNYELRRKLIEVFSNLDFLNFQWFGRGWYTKNTEKFNRQNLKYIKADLLSLSRLSSKSYAKYAGTIDNKSILHMFKTTCVIENLSFPNNYYTEKLFEPLEYGCIPIFLKTNSITNKIFEYISSSEFSGFMASNLIELLESVIYLSAMEIADTKKIASRFRNELNSFLELSGTNTNLNRCYGEIAKLL